MMLLFLTVGQAIGLDTCNPAGQVEGRATNTPVSITLLFRCDSPLEIIPLQFAIPSIPPETNIFSPSFPYELLYIEYNCSEHFVFDLLWSRTNLFVCDFWNRIFGVKLLQYAYYISLPTPCVPTVYTILSTSE